MGRLVGSARRYNILGALVLVCVLCCSGRALANIVGSEHDFSDESWTNNICDPCHTPHNADTSVTAPLWNHENTVHVFTDLYSSPTLKETPGQPGGESMVCLSCHDGTVALDSFGNVTGSNKLAPGDPGYIGTDLSDDHPIGILWSHKEPATCANCHQEGGDDLPFYSGQVECSTCHDPHNAGTGTKMLRLPMTNSTLCRHCHGK
ncbi:cytochrome c3 family protein [Thermodesulfobacteriota bacterium]